MAFTLLEPRALSRGAVYAAGHDERDMTVVGIPGSVQGGIYPGGIASHIAWYHGG